MKQQRQPFDFKILARMSNKKPSLNSFLEESVREETTEKLNSKHREQNEIEFLNKKTNERIFFESWEYIQANGGLKFLLQNHGNYTDIERVDYEVMEDTEESRANAQFLNEQEKIKRQNKITKKYTRKKVAPEVSIKIFCHDCDEDVFKEDTGKHAGHELTQTIVRKNSSVTTKYCW